MKKTILLMITSKMMKYLGVNLTKEGQDVRAHWNPESIAGRRERTISWSDITWPWFRKSNTAEMLILSKATYRFHAILIKTCSFIIFFYRNRKIYPKFIWNLKDPQIATKKKKIEKEQSWRCHTSEFQNLLQSFGNQNSIILACRQTHGMMA